MQKYIHPNAIKSSNLIRLSSVLTLVSYFLFSDRNSPAVMIATLIAIFLMIGAAYLIRKGYNWVRWVLFVLFLIGMTVDIIALPSIFKLGLLNGCFTILQDAIQIVALILLFIPFKQTQDELTPIEISAP